MHITYKDAVTFEIADKSQHTPAYFLFGVRKSGSSILNSMVSALSSHNGVHYVDVAGGLFAAGLRTRDWQNDTQLAKIVTGGNLYGGFRDMPLGLLENSIFRSARKILMVRDPRDALVSEYFSNAYSHSIPQAGNMKEDMLSKREDALNSALEEYVIRRAPELARTLRLYTNLPYDLYLRVLKYEKGIMNKREMLADVCAFFEWSAPEILIEQILGWADVMPEVENPQAFVRRVRPRDYLEKLSNGTIRTLNELLARELHFFDYA